MDEQKTDETPEYQAPAILTEGEIVQDVLESGEE
jgi:hypothetical protein